MSRLYLHTGFAAAVITLGAVVTTWLAAAPHAQVGPSKREAQTFKQKVATINALGQKPSKQLRRTTVSEAELNAYLVHDAQPDFPAGVVDPWVDMVGPGRLTGRAVVDLNAVRKAQNPTSLFDPRSYLMGQLPVTATGVLTTADGMGRFQLESATVGGIPVPKTILQEIVSYYSRTPQTPSGVSLDDPFPLPARIREVQVQPDQAIIVQ